MLLQEDRMRVFAITNEPSGSEGPLVHVSATLHNRSAMYFRGCDTSNYIVDQQIVDTLVGEAFAECRQLDTAASKASTPRQMYAPPPAKPQSKATSRASSDEDSWGSWRGETQRDSSNAEEIYPEDRMTKKSLDNKNQCACVQSNDTKTIIGKHMDGLYQELQRTLQDSLRVSDTDADDIRPNPTASSSSATGSRSAQPQPVGIIVGVERPLQADSAAPCVDREDVLGTGVDRVNSKQMIGWHVILMHHTVSLAGVGHVNKHVILRVCHHNFSPKDISGASSSSSEQVRLPSQLNEATSQSSQPSRTVGMTVGWTCQICTLMNRNDVSTCAGCEGPRPASIQVQTQAELLMCGICLGVMSDPVQMKCGHTYCRQCVMVVAQTHIVPRCPECRRKFDLDDVAPNRIARELVEQYRKNEADSQAAIAAQAAAERAAKKSSAERVQSSSSSSSKRPPQQHSVIHARASSVNYGGPTHNSGDDPNTILEGQQLILDDGCLIDVRELESRANAMGRGTVLKEGNLQLCSNIAGEILQERKLFDAIKSRWRLEFHTPESTPPQSRVTWYTSLELSEQQIIERESKSDSPFDGCIDSVIYKADWPAVSGKLIDYAAMREASGLRLPPGSKIRIVCATSHRDDSKCHGGIGDVYCCCKHSFCKAAILKAGMASSHHENDIVQPIPSAYGECKMPAHSAPQIKGTIQVSDYIVVTRVASRIITVEAGKD